MVNDLWLKYIFAYSFDNTNLDLIRRGRHSFKDMDEVLRIQVVVRLENRFEFGDRDELWGAVVRKYMPDVEFGNTVMGCDRFKEIFS